MGINYFDFYHFLEGIVFYDQWSNLIDEKSKHKKIKNGKNEWCDKGEIHQAFEKSFKKFKDSILVVSYRDDGIPTIEAFKLCFVEFCKFFFWCKLELVILR